MLCPSYISKKSAIPSLSLNLHGIVRNQVQFEQAFMVSLLLTSSCLGKLKLFQCCLSPSSIHEVLNCSDKQQTIHFHENKTCLKALVLDNITFSGQSTPASLSFQPLGLC